jgi:hypothetical protein
VEEAGLDLGEVDGDEHAPGRGDEAAAEIDGVGGAGGRGVGAGAGGEPIVSGIEIQGRAREILEVEAGAAGPAAGLFRAEVFQGEGGAAIGGAEAGGEVLVDGAGAVDGAEAGEGGDGGDLGPYSSSHS